jgi:hypothetical protein
LTSLATYHCAPAPALAEEIKRFDGDLSRIPAIPDELQDRYRTAFQIDGSYLIAAARAGRSGSTSRSRSTSSSPRRTSRP